MTMQSYQDSGYNLYWFVLCVGAPDTYKPVVLFTSLYTQMHTHGCVFNLQKAMDIPYDSENDVQIDDGDYTDTESIG